MVTNLRSALEPHLDPHPPVPVEGVPAAVLLPVLEGPEPALVFTKRTETLRHHGGEISFPGGVRSPEDADLRATALRETQEELGLPPEAVVILGALEPVDTFVSGFLVVPFVGLVAERPEFIPSPEEIAEVIEVPIGDLMALEREVTWIREGTSIVGHVFQVREHTIWGATGRMLKGFLDLLRKEGWT